MTVLLTLLLLTKCIVIGQTINATIIISCGNLESSIGIIDELLTRQHNVDLYLPSGCKHRVNADCSGNFNLINIKSSSLSRSYIEELDHNHYQQLYNSNLMGTSSIIKQELNQTFHIIKHILQNDQMLLFNPNTNILLTGSHNYLVTDLAKLLNIPCITIHSFWTIPPYFDNVQLYPTLNSMDHINTFTEQLTHIMTYYTSDISFSAQIIHELNRLQNELNLTLTTNLRNDYFKNQIHLIQSAPPLSPYVASTPLLQQLGSLVSKQNNIRVLNYQTQTRKISEWIEAGSNHARIIYISLGLHSRSIKFEYYKSIMASLIFYFKTSLSNSEPSEFRVVFILPGYHIFQLNAHFSEFFGEVDEEKWDRFIIMEKACNEYDLLHDDNIALFLSAGDSMSVSYSIVNKKPMLLFPQWETQRVNAQKMKQLRCGIILDKQQLSKNPSYLIEAIRKMLDYDEVYQLNVANAFKRLSYFGGCQKAVDVIEYVAECGYEEWKSKEDTLLFIILCLLLALITIMVSIGICCIISKCKTKKNTRKYKSS